MYVYIILVVLLLGFFYFILSKYKKKFKEQTYKLGEELTELNKYKISYGSKCEKRKS